DGTESSSPDDIHGAAEYPFHSSDHGIDQPCIPKYEAGLNTAGGVSADHGFRTDQFHLAQFGGLGEEGLCRDSQAGSNDASEVVAFSRDGTKGCGGAEIDDDEIAAIFMIGRCGIHQPVAADFFWVGVTEGESRIRVRGDDHGM